MLGEPWLTVDAYKAWARIPPTDTVDDTAIAGAAAAVMSAVGLRCPVLYTDAYPDGPGGQDDVREAALLWTNRLMSRRNSPDGVVGVADFGTAQIRSTDSDIRQLLSPYTATVMA